VATKEETAMTAIIFSDLKGFSTIQLNRVTGFVHKKIQEFKASCLTESNCFFDLSTGDGLFLCCASAVEAAEIALRLRDFFAGINWLKEGAPNILPIRIGLHFVELTKESDDKKVTNVFGKSITEGARIEPVTAPGKVYCSKTFHDILMGNSELNVIARSLGERELAKGFGTMELFELMWAAETHSDDIVPSVIRERHVPLANTQLSELIRDVMCFNQGEIIQYFYTAGELHKEIKRSYRNKNSKKAKQKLDSLDNFFDTGIRNVLLENFRMAAKTFALEKGPDNLPRMCFKYNYYEQQGGEQYIGTYNIGQEAYRSSFKCRVQENSASAFVEENGYYYIKNDLPSEAKAKNYENPRLDLGKVDVYTPPYNLKPFVPFAGRQPPDTSWAKCWKPHPGKNKQIIQPPPVSCYKSTLVVPSTLKNNRLSNQFWEKIAAKGKGSDFFRLRDGIDQSQVVRQIYGYFCLDSPEIGYFNEGFDVDFGYLFADIISIFYIICLTFTTLSDVYKKVQQMPPVTEKRIAIPRRID